MANYNQGNTDGKVQSDPLKPTVGLYLSPCTIMWIFQASELREEIQKIKNDLATSQQAVLSATTNEEREHHGAGVVKNVGDLCQTEMEYRNVREKHGQ